MTTPGVRHPNPDDLEWRRLASELVPSKSLDRNDKAKAAATDRITTSVTVVGTLLTGLGILAAGQAINATARVLVAFAVAAAASAVGCVLAAQLLSMPRYFKLEDLRDVQAWYLRQFDTGRRTTLTGIVLVLFAAALAGSAAILSLVHTATVGPTVVVSQTLQTAKGAKSTAAATANIHVNVTFRGLPPGQVATVAVIASNKVLASAAVTSAPDGTATSALALSNIPTSQRVVIDAKTAHQYCHAALVPGQEHPSLTCRTG
jgi:hypothetical protein